MRVYRVKGVEEHEAIDLDQIVNIYIEKRSDGRTAVKVRLNNEKDTWLWGRDHTHTTQIYDELVQVWEGNKTKGTNMLNDILADMKGYMRSNKDIIYTVLFLVILDHVIFNGAFRERLKALVEGMLRKVEAKVNPMNVIDGAVTKTE